MQQLSKTIYIICPPKKKTGGTELLHQLAYTLRELGECAKLVYWDTKTTLEYEIPTDFQKYITRSYSIEEIQDISSSIIVFPEIYTYLFLNRYKNTTKMIWWLSVDNFVASNGLLNHLKYWGLKSTIGRTIRHEFNLFKLKKLDQFQIHLCQSYYSISFLKEMGIRDNNIYYLSDYINDEYMDCCDIKIEKEDNILYNPKKGIEITRKLMKAMPTYNWVPIENMTTVQVQELLQRSKVYIDFGNHPGKDRIPREAAISGCCVITGKRGSANYYEDVRIPDEYKFEENKTGIQNAVLKIQECIREYDDHIIDFAEYRAMILDEKKCFINCCKKIFCEEAYINK